MITFSNAAIPENLWASIEASDIVTLNWQAPIMSRKHGTILYYTVKCSTQWQGLRDEQIANTVLSHQSLELQPHTSYQCCVAAVNEVGGGQSSCQTVVTHETGIAVLSQAKGIINEPSMATSKWLDKPLLMY